MAQFCGSDNAVWSEEHDSVPLKQRLKLLLASQRLSGSSAILNGVFVKKEYDQCDSQDFHPDCPSKKLKSGCLTQEKCPAGETEADKYVNPYQLSASEMTNANVGSPHLPSMSSNFPAKVKVEQVDDSAVSTLGNIVNSPSLTDNYVSPNQLSASEMINANDGIFRLPSMSSNFPAKVKVEQADDGAVSTLGNIVNNSSVTDKYMSPNQLSALKMINASDGSFRLPSMSSNFPVKVKVEQAADNAVSTLGNIVNSFSVTDVQPIVKFRTETPDDILDDLDHVVLKERQRLLLSMCYTGFEPPLLNKKSSFTKTCTKKGSSSTTEVMQVNSSRFFNKAIDNIGQEITAIGQCGSYADDKVHTLVGNNIKKIQRTTGPGSRDEIVARVPRITQISTPKHCYQNDKVSCSANLTRAGKVDWIYSFENILSKHGPSGGAELSSGGNKTVFGSGTKELVNVKIEPTDSMELERMAKDSVGRLTFSNVFQAKTQFEVPYDSFEDKLDHMILRERMKLPSLRDLCPLRICGNSESSSKVVPLALESQPIASEYARPLKINRPRKRRKTATDSVGTALEEDAPGLLQVLVEKGVSVDEMKLYGQTEFDGALDELPNEDSFSELEAVISKLFSQRSSLLKFAPLRCNKGEKASYCLACLFSLVEQARYLQFRNWPVEWGWCRDLQSFIFVFERHNRIVLERPEYGYATYFFELVDSLSVEWQIKRLVTAMKLSSCSRVTLIENRALEIGEDLTEEEARVLVEYGWIPNSGLATMLNYCDRVVHDRKNEKDISDWRAKIGKLLMEGYNGGTIVSPDVPMKFAEYNVNQNPQIKLELS